MTKAESYKREHTPGNWSVDEHGFVYADDFVRLTTVKGEDGVEKPHKEGLVALLYTPWKPGIGPRNFRANGQLTAAAPRLLDAAIALLEFWDNGSSVHPGAEVVAELRAAVLAAIPGAQDAVQP